MRPGSTSSSAPLLRRRTSPRSSGATRRRGGRDRRGQPRRAARPGLRPHPRRRPRAPRPRPRPGAAGGGRGRRSATQGPASVTIGADAPLLPLARRRRRARLAAALPARADEVPRAPRPTSTWTSTSPRSRPTPAAGRVATAAERDESTAWAERHWAWWRPSCCARSTATRSSITRRRRRHRRRLRLRREPRPGWSARSRCGPDLMGRGAGVAPLLGALHRMRARRSDAGRDRLGGAGRAVRPGRRDARPRLPRPPQGARVNLLSRRRATSSSATAPSERRSGAASVPARLERSAPPPRGTRSTIDADGTVMIEAADPAGAVLRPGDARPARAAARRVAAGRRRSATGPTFAVARRHARHLARQGADDGDALRAHRPARGVEGQPVQLYTEHTFAYRDHETVWRDASPMTADEIRDARRVLHGAPHRAGRRTRTASAT